MTITIELLAELKRLEAAAAPGEWRAFVSAIDHEYGGIETHDPKLREDCDDIVLPTSSANQDDLLFIAAARNHLCELIDEIESLDAALSLEHEEANRLRTQLADAKSEIERLKEAQSDVVTEFVVTAYDEGGYGENKSKTFPGASEAIAYANSLEKRFGPTITKRITRPAIHIIVPFNQEPKP